MNSPQRVARMADGFNATARDLDRALLVALFSSLEMLLIGHARELSWSRAREVRAEATPFRLNLSALADVAHVRRTSLSPLFRDLVRMRVFLKLEDGLFLINKDFREWLNKDGTPRLDSGQVEWCMSAMRPKFGERKARAEAMHLSEKSDTPLSEKSDGRGDAPVGKIRHPLSEKSDTPCLKNQTVRTSPPTTPCEERTSEEFKKSSEEKSAALFAREGIPPFPSEASAPSVSPGEHTCTQAQAEEIWALLWRSFKSQGLCQGWYEHQRLYPFERWMVAIRVAVRRGKSPKAIAYLESIAGDESQTGEEKPAAKRKDEPLPGYFRELPWPEIGLYKFHKWPVPRDHPEYAAYMAEKASSVPQETPADVQANGKPSDADKAL